MTPNLCLMRIDNLYLIGKMFKNISPDSVWSGRSCPANLGVWSCPVRKLIRPIRSHLQHILSHFQKCQFLLTHQIRKFITELTLMHTDTSNVCPFEFVCMLSLAKPHCIGDMPCYIHAKQIHTT